MATNEPINEEEKKGVEAILFLQSMNGIEEPPDRALRNWRSFSEYDKKNTLRAYDIFRPQPEEEETRGQ